MSRTRLRRSTRAHRSDTILLGLVGGVVAVGVVSLLVGLALKGNKGASPLNELSLDWTLAPVWQSPPKPSPVLEEGIPRRLEVYIDVSEPMGGYLPPPRAPREVSGFRSLVNQVLDHVVSVAGETESPIWWYKVASSPERLSRKPDPLDRALFKGGESRLDLALRQITRGLDSGDLEMAALVSDLIATEELIGAMGAAKALSDWGRSDRVRTGELGVGLLAARASYWGIYGKCGAPDRGLGCWFSEQAGEYRPLTRVINRPFYILVLGRNLDNVDRTGQALTAAAKRLGLETQWELLSEAARPQPVRIECKTRKAGEDQKQHALFRDEDGTFKCQRADTVDLVCDLPRGLFQGAPDLKASWQEVRTELQEEGRALLGIDCGRLRSSPPQKDFVVQAEGVPAGGRRDQWASWSAETDEVEEDLEKTLRLEKFVEKVQLLPDRIRITSPPLLRAQKP